MILNPFIVLKKLAPKTLYGRTFLIIFTPLILVQIVTTYIFLDRHLDSVTRLLADSIASEVAVATSVYERDPSGEQAALSSRDKEILSKLHIHAAFISGKMVRQQSKKKSSKHPWADEILENSLQMKISHPYALTTDGNNIFITLAVGEGALEISLPYKRLISKTTPLVLLGTFGASALFLSIALLFMRNQVRPIQKLAEAAECFGKGQMVKNFRPQGALEVRKAAHAFLQMKDRIQSQISQRTEMLAGISHDLRTPLTRMKLQLALLAESPEITHLQKDITEMELMIQEYLDFVRGEGEETPIPCAFKQFLKDIVEDMRRKGARIHVSELGNSGSSDKPLILRPLAMRRALVNLLSNAHRYAHSINLHTASLSDTLLIHIDDDGPGIPDAAREDVFRPFYRLESSRNIETGGIGLGLTIARDIVRAHGGDILLSESPEGGLRSTVKIPY
jgi:two-component system osmolarity sensor histidine kinase EnvZ